MFQKEIIKWYKKNKRDLPWRNTNDPYKIWLSEILLQQTRVDQGLPYYYKFIEKFPDIQTLALADEQEILKLWQGLGYYSRARNLHFTAKEIIRLYKGKFPDDHDKILKLKGIGAYTAAAIASFAFKKEYAVVDGNVQRLVSRFFGVLEPVDGPKGKTRIYAIVNELIKGFDPATFNQAIMEFGGNKCRSSAPECNSCPLAIDCYALKNNVVKEIPKKAKKILKKNRYFNYFLFQYRDLVFLNKRIEKDIWQNLFDFPLIETEKEESLLFLKSSNKFSSWFEKLNLEEAGISKIYVHVLTHQNIHARFYKFEIKRNFSYQLKNQGFIPVEFRNLDKYPVSVLIEKYFSDIRT